MMCDFDSGFDVSDTNDTTEFDGDIEILDTSDIESSISEEVETDDIPATDELDDGLYHATRMSEEEINRIDEMWDETSKKESDVEPYQATRLSEMEQVEEVKEPYKSTRLSDSSDISGELSDQSDMAGVEMPESLEEQFAAEIEAISFDDLSAEQARLDSLSQMDDLDIFAEYDAAQKSEYDPELFASLTDGLPRETLEHLKEGLATGDPDVYDYFGLNGGEDDGNDVPPTLSRKR